MLKVNNIGKIVKKAVIVTISSLTVLGGLTLGQAKPVDADYINDKIVMPDDSLGYTKDNLMHWRDNPVTKQELTRASIVGMSYNDSHSAGDTRKTKHDRKVVDMKHLSGRDRRELAHFTVRLINSARESEDMPDWTYTSNAERFAMDTAKYYTQDHAGNSDSDHDVHAILKAARKNGLRTDLGQVYEDESGFNVVPHARYSTMWHAKLMLRFNIEQMLFGGWTSRRLSKKVYYKDLKNPSRYTEWDHANDLINLGEREVGVAFSVRGNDEVSVHILSVPQEYIVDSDLYYR